MTDGVKQLLKADIEFLRKENRKYRKTIELQNKRLADLESISLWCARRMPTKSYAMYVKGSVERNKKMGVVE